MIFQLIMKQSNKSDVLNIHNKMFRFIKKMLIAAMAFVG